MGTPCPESKGPGAPSAVWQREGGSCRMLGLGGCCPTCQAHGACCDLFPSSSSSAQPWGRSVSACGCGRAFVILKGSLPRPPLGTGGQSPVWSSWLASCCVGSRAGETQLSPLGAGKRGKGAGVGFLLSGKHCGRCRPSFWHSWCLDGLVWIRSKLTSNSEQARGADQELLPVLPDLCG